MPTAALVYQPMAMPGTALRKSNVLINDTNSLTQLCLGSKAKMNHYLQKLLRTEKELEVTSTK